MVGSIQTSCSPNLNDIDSWLYNEFQGWIRSGEILQEAAHFGRVEQTRSVFVHNIDGVNWANSERPP